MATSPITHEIFLDHGRVTIECPRLTSDRELADVPAAFVETVRVRPPAETVDSD